MSLLQESFPILYSEKIYANWYVGYSGQNQANNYVLKFLDLKNFPGSYTQAPITCSHCICLISKFLRSLSSAVYNS